MTTGIYSQRDIAQLLFVTPAAVGNWRARYDDTPPASYASTDGREFWDIEGMAAWQEWYRLRTGPRARPHSRGHDAIEELRNTLRKS